MAYVKVADIAQDHGGQSVTHELYQDGGTALGHTLKVVSDVMRRAGGANSKLLEWRKKTEVAYQVKDDARYLIGLFDGADEDDFRLDVKKGGALYNRLNVVLGTESVPKGETNPVVKLTASDGIPRLKSIEFDVATLQTSYPNGITVAELFQVLLDAVGHEIPVRVYLEAQHDDQDTTRANAHGIRWPVRSWLEGEERRSYYDVLQRACEYYQAQVMQVWGEWMVIERSYRGGPMDYANCAFGGAITKVAADDRQIAIGDAAILREKATDVYLQPISRVVSRHQFRTAPFKNARFQEWTAGDTRPLGWEELGAGVTKGSAYGRSTARVDTLNAGIKQESQDAVSAQDRLDVVIDVVIDYAPTAPASTTLTVDLATIRLTNTTDGQDRWLDKDGNWQLTPTNVEHDVFTSSDSFVLKIINTQAPVGGTLVFSTRFDPNPNADADVDFDAWDYVELGYETLRVSELTSEIEYEAANTVETTEPDVEEEFGIGDYDTSAIGSGAIGASEYLDASSAVWEYTGSWGGVPNFHRRRAIQRLEQQAQRLNGLDVVLSPDTAFTVADTMVYGAVDYVPVYEEENFSKRTRRIVAYELRSDAANADPKYNPQPAPTFRPNPNYRVRLEYASEDTFEVYLDVARDGYSVAVEWEYEVGGAVISSGTTAFGDSPFLNIHVNAGNPLDRDDASPTVRAWAWSDISGGAGQGMRQARIFEQVLTPFLDGIPSVSYNVLPPEYDGSTGYVFKVAFTGDPDTKSVKAEYEKPAGTLVDTNVANGRVGVVTVNPNDPCPPGETARIKLRGYSQAAAAGTAEANETVLDVKAPQVEVGQIPDGSILGNKLAGVAQSINTNLEFFPDATNTSYLLRWQPKNGEAQITLEYMDGTSYVLNSGSVDLRTYDTGGGAAQRVYIYFDPAVSTTDLQFTTNYTDVLATSGGRKFLGFAERATDASDYLYFVPAEGGSNGIISAPIIYASKLQVLAAKTGSLEIDGLLDSSGWAGTVDGSGNITGFSAAAGFAIAGASGHFDFEWAGGHLRANASGASLLSGSGALGTDFSGWHFDLASGALIGYSLDTEQLRLDNQGRIVVGTALQDGITITQSGVRGYSGGVLQAQMRASDGKITAAGGDIVLDVDGISIGAGFIRSQVSGVTLSAATDVVTLTGQAVSVGNGLLVANEDDQTVDIDVQEFQLRDAAGTTVWLDVDSLNGFTFNLPLGPIELKGLVPGSTANTLYNDGGDLYWAGTAITGGSVGQQDLYSTFTDGTNSASAGSTSDTFKFRAGTGITVAVGSNDATHGDNLLIGLDTSGDWTGTFDGYESADLAVLDENETITGQWHFNTADNTIPVSIGRGSSIGAEVMHIGVIDRFAIFKYIEDTSVEGLGNFGQYVFYVAGNSGENDEVVLRMSHNIFQYKDNDIWHEGNDGAGSGLDADLLDGYDGSEFAILAEDETINGNWTFSQPVTFNGDIIAPDFHYDATDRSLKSNGSFYVIIDANNNEGATTRFSVRTDATTKAAAEELFYVHESLPVWAKYGLHTTANLTVDGTAAVGNKLWVGNGSTADAGLITVQTNNSSDAGVQYVLADGTTVDGYVKWDANEDLFLYGDSILLQAAGPNNALLVDTGANVQVYNTLKSTSFASGAFGSGWQVHTDGGQTYLEVDNLRVRGTFRSHIFQKDVIRATNGFFFFSDASQATEDVVTPATVGNAFTFYVKEQVFQDTDILIYRDINSSGSVGNEARFRISSVVGSTTRNGQTVYRYGAVLLSGTSVTIGAGGTIVRIGNTTDSARQGSIFVDSSIPALDIYDGVNSSAAFDALGKVKVRLGKLDGITDPDINGGVALSGYGLYSENVYLKGEIVAEAGSIAGNLVTSGISASNITTGTLDASVVTVTNLNASNITTGQLTSISINNGSGTFSVDAAGNLTATSASIAGEITATSGSLSGLAISGTLTMGASGAITNIGADYALNNEGLSLSGASSDSPLFTSGVVLDFGGGRLGIWEYHGGVNPRGHIDMPLAGSELILESTNISLEGDIINLNGATSVVVNGSDVWHAGNDGVDSGLDADLLDGIQGDQFAQFISFNGAQATTPDATLRLSVDGFNYDIPVKQV